jgi:hypothetical protein
MIRQKRNRDLIEPGFERVERDDRLFDVFIGHDSEKGIELWDRWNEDTVDIIRIHLPKGDKGTQEYIMPRALVEEALLRYQRLDLK